MITDAKFLQFGTLSTDEIRGLSVCEVQIPTPQGKKNSESTPYDQRMGVLENGVLCQTCSKNANDCLGHFGHMEFPVPVYNKMYMGIILLLLNSVCVGCSRSRLLPKHLSVCPIGKIKKMKRLKAIRKRSAKMIECPWEGCHEPLYKFDFTRDDIYRNESKFSAGECYSVFSRMSEETLLFLGFNDCLSGNREFCLPGSVDKFHLHQNRPENLIWQVFPVLPPCNRPYVVRDGQQCNDDLTEMYNSILKVIKKIRDKLSEGEDTKSLESDLNYHVWTLMHNKEEKSKVSSGGRAHKCITSRLKGKEGRVQTNIGGKRVDQSCRSVITGGGTSLRNNELGVPESIADELSQQEVVRSWNYARLMSLVAQGKVIKVIRRGVPKRLDVLPGGGREFILAPDDIVERKLQDGDDFPFNRQPTLRPESIMSFQVKRIPGYAFRLQEWCTKSFNAD